MAGSGLVVSRQGATQVLTLDRPRQLNAVDSTLLRELIAAVSEAGAAPDVRAVLVAGNGRAFCAGADVKEFADGAAAADAEATRRRLIARLVQALRELPKPVVAAVHGPTLGAGAALALACDMVVAADDLRFGYPEARHGIVPGVVLPGIARHVPPKVAFEMLANGKLLDAAQAQAYGLVNEVVTVEGLLPAAHRVAGGWHELADGLAAQIKDLLAAADDLPLSTAARLGADSATWAQRR